MFQIKRWLLNISIIIALIICGGNISHNYWQFVLSLVHHGRMFVGSCFCLFLVWELVVSWSQWYRLCPQFCWLRKNRKSQYIFLLPHLLIDFNCMPSTLQFIKLLLLLLLVWSSKGSNYEFNSAKWFKNYRKFFAKQQIRWFIFPMTY